MSQIINDSGHDLTIHSVARLHPTFFDSCSQPVNANSSAIIQLRYHHTWRTLTVNGAALHLDSLRPTSSTNAASDPAVRMTAEVRVVPNRRLWYQPPWLSHADAALLRSRMTEPNECTFAVHVVRDVQSSTTGPSAINVFDLIIPSLPSSLGQPSVRILSFGIQPSRPRRLPSFAFPSSDSGSPSSTYHWRSGILLPLLLYIVLPILSFFFVGGVAILAFRIFRWSRSSHRRRSYPHKRSLSSASPSAHTTGIFNLWRPSSPTPSFPNIDRDSVMGRLWRDALARGKLRSSGLEVPNAYHPVIDDSPRARGRTASEKRLSTIHEEAP